jgi:hypothetical protein
LQALNNKKKCGGIFFDLEKTSDWVDHNILMNKINYYGVNGVIFSLIKSYLENRYQRVKFNNLSNWGKISKEVPQGTTIIFNISTFLSGFYSILVQQILQ